MKQKATPPTAIPTATPGNVVDFETETDPVPVLNEVRLDASEFVSDWDGLEVVVVVVVVVCVWTGKDSIGSIVLVVVCKGLWGSLGTPYRTRPSLYLGGCVQCRNELDDR